MSALREDIMRLLRLEREIAADELAARLGAPHAAVEAALRELRAAGVGIALGPRCALQEWGDSMEPWSLQPCLRGRYGQPYLFRPEVDTTMRLARELGEDGAPAGATVCADRQTAGRGRLGRAWQAEPGASILMSIVARPGLELHRMQGSTLAAGVAVAEAVTEVAGAAATLKWPNDVRLDGRKCSGILTELVAQDRTPFLVFGIGINVRPAAVAPDLRHRATSVLEHALQPVRRPELAAAVLWHLEEWLERWREDGFEAVRRRFLERCDTLGQTVTVRRVVGEGSAVIEGRAVDVDGEGRLVLETEAGRLALTAGEVTLSSEL